MGTSTGLGYFQKKFAHIIAQCENSCGQCCPVQCVECSSPCQAPSPCDSPSSSQPPCNPCQAPCQPEKYILFVTADNEGKRSLNPKRRQTGKFTATNCNPCKPRCFPCPTPASYSVPVCAPPRGPCGTPATCSPCPTPCSPCGSCCTPCTGPCMDDDENLIESMIPYIRCMSKIKKMQLRVLFQNIIYETMLDSTNTHCMPVYPPYRASKPICTQDDDEIFFWGLIPHLKSLDPEKRLFARKRFFDELYKVYSDVGQSCVKQEGLEYKDLCEKLNQKKKEQNQKRLDKLRKELDKISLDNGSQASDALELLKKNKNNLRTQQFPGQTEKTKDPFASSLSFPSVGGGRENSLTRSQNLQSRTMQLPE